MLREGALSDEESKKLDEHTIAYSSTALYEELNQEHLCPMRRTVPLSTVIEELENANEQQHKRISAVSDGSYKASTFARNSLFGVVTALTAANRSETALEKIFYDLEAREQREADFQRIQSVYRTTSKLIQKWKKSEAARTDELAQEISKNAVEFKQLYQDYHNLPRANASAL